MSPEVWVALIAGVVQVVALITSAIMLYLKLSHYGKNLSSYGEDLSHLNHSMNSMREQLVEAAGKAGQKKGADDERARQVARDEEEQQPGG